jgi:hypothetical protein
MSAISDIYDAIASEITTALPSHRELNNPYFPENDAELSYDTAYGLAFAEGSNLLTNPRSGVEVRNRNFIVTLTRRKFATSRDRASRKTAEKNLLEDWTTLMDAFAEAPRLGNPSLVQQFFYSSDDGIEFLSLDRNRTNILLIRTNMTVEYEQIVTLNSC